MHLERAEPAVLVVDRRDPPAGRDPHSLPRGLHHLVERGPDVAVAKGPGRVLAQHAGGLTALVALDHAARLVRAAVGPRERGAVEPERVVVLGHQCNRHVAGHAIERPAGRADRASRRRASRGRAAIRRAPPRACLGHARERFVQRARPLEPGLAQPERPGGEVHVRVGEAGHDAAARRARPDALPTRGRLSHALARHRERRERAAAAGSSVRMLPPSRTRSTGGMFVGRRPGTSALLLRRHRPPVVEWLDRGLDVRAP